VPRGPKGQYAGSTRRCLPPLDGAPQSTAVTADRDASGLLDVRGASRWVAAEATSVSLDAAGLDHLAGLLAGSPVEAAPWSVHHLGDGPAEPVAGWTLALSALNFSFWEDEPRWRVDGLDGYLALARALRRAHAAGSPIADPAHVAGWTVDDLAGILHGDAGGSPLPPMMAERHSVLTELAGWLCDAHGGSAMTALRAVPSAAALATELADQLRGFRDVAEYHGRRVPLLKRAQIAAHDCATALDDRAPPGLRRLSALTAFADYKLPQVLRAHGVLVYASELATKVDRRVPLQSGSDEEIEIRALSVVAVDELVARLRNRGLDWDAARVDGQLWWRGQTRRERDRPYHRTRTIWY